MTSPGFGIYIHWPYCATICPYCDFNVHRARDADPQPLLDAIARDLASLKERYGKRVADTVFFGGGTPSLLHGEHIANLLALIAQTHGLAPNAEITLEANPEDRARFAEHAAAGISRFSIGVQALDDKALSALGRRHTAEEGIAAVESAAATGQRVSIDLIYAREGQTKHEWRDELRNALALPIEHASLYQLTIETGTAFERAVRRGALHPPQAEQAADLFELTQDVCDGAGFPAYEISNHARDQAAQSQHNLIYWRGGDWLGIGPGAHGRITHNGTRFATQTRRAPSDYVAAPSEQPEQLSPEEGVDEALMMGIRIAEGLSRARLAARPPSEARIAQLVSDGLLIATPERLTLTPRGRLFADRIALELAR